MAAGSSGVDPRHLLDPISTDEGDQHPPPPPSSTTISTEIQDPLDEQFQQSRYGPQFPAVTVSDSEILRTDAPLLLNKTNDHTNSSSNTDEDHTKSTASSPLRRVRKKKKKKPSKRSDTLSNSRTSITISLNPVSTSVPPSDPRPLEGDTSRGPSPSLRTTPKTSPRTVIKDSLVRKNSTRSHSRSGSQSSSTSLIPSASRLLVPTVVTTPGPVQSEAELPPPAHYCSPHRSLDDLEAGGDPPQPPIVGASPSLLSTMWTSTSRITRSGRVSPAATEKPLGGFSTLNNTMTAEDFEASHAVPSEGAPGQLAFDSNPKIVRSSEKLAPPHNPFHIHRRSDHKKVRQTVETLFFRDNIRTIDYVLVYRDPEDPADRRRRKVFQQNLINEGLQIEKEDKSQSQDGQTYFVKIHAPWELLIRYAEILKIKKPIKKDDTPNNKKDFFGFIGMKNPFLYNEELIPPEPSFFSTGFNVQRIEQFIIKDRDTFFLPSQRSQIVWEILIRVPYHHEEQSLGISRLLSMNVYSAAFMLHDGRYDKDGLQGHQCDRRLLYLEWATIRKWYKKQPIHLVKRYFGEKMAMYFAWLGFYTQMLIPAAVIGCFTFVCGLFFMNSDYNKPSNEICYDEDVQNITMCPLCDELCGFWTLKDSCFMSRFTFLFDNPVTVFFSIAMSFWATMFLEMWKRRQSVLQWQWDLENYEEEEEVRPEFHANVKTTRINPVTKKSEPFIPFYSKLGRYVAANSLVLMMVALMLTAVVSVMIYRMAVAVAFHKLEGSIFKRNAKFVASITAAMLNLLIIVIFNYFYRKVVIFLTDIECPRTETEYEDSFTLKMFLFQFINYYSSLIYIAVFKGRFFYHPGDAEARTTIFMRLRYDMCDPTGCLPELCIQLVVIMVGKQMLNNFIEIAWPIVRVWWNRRTGHDNTRSAAYTRWEQDYDLAHYTRLSLFDEYLEMVVQYGFVTLFVAAFPLAPFFALVNNVVEIRLDAYKYLAKCRRPRPERIQDIGIWYSILRVITYTSVLTNALVISYSSDFIPRLVYMYGYSNHTNLRGYVDNILAEFNTSDYVSGMGPDRGQFPDPWPSTCRYRAFRYPPSHAEKYEITLQFWHVFTARLAFIFFFEHVVFVLTGILAYLVPDIPVEVKLQMRREKKVEKETLFDTEMRRMREERQEMNLDSPRTLSPSLDEMSMRSHSPVATMENTPENSPVVRRSSSQLVTP